MRPVSTSIPMVASERTIGPILRRWIEVIHETREESMGPDNGFSRRHANDGKGDEVGVVKMVRPRWTVLQTIGDEGEERFRSPEDGLYVELTSGSFTGPWLSSYLTPSGVVVCGARDQFVSMS